MTRDERALLALVARHVANALASSDLALLRACDVLPPATFENQLVEELFALHGAIVGTRI